MTSDIEARVPVTPKVLREARLRANLTVPVAVSKINQELESEGESSLTEGNLQAWEQGSSLPSLLEAEVAARIYLIPFIDLFQPSLPDEPLTDFRRLAGDGSPLSYEARTRLAQFDRFYRAARRISTALGIAEDTAIPQAPFTSLTSEADIEALAKSIRQQFRMAVDSQPEWKSDAEALEYWRSAIEETGTFVFSLSLPVEDCRGASRWEQGGPPAILLNIADAISAQLFSLLHEYAHLVFAVERVEGAICDPALRTASQEEQVANRLAAAVLLPRALLRSLLPQSEMPANYSAWPSDVRVMLRRALRVSHSVIGIRLEQLGFVKEAGVVPWRYGQSFGRARGKPVWQRYRRYLGTRTLDLARTALREERISPVELSRIIGIKVRDLETAVG
jgi:Zn-dependent peptidase ImmA (M78 family)